MTTFLLSAKRISLACKQKLDFSLMRDELAIN
jgi:hypothetical protein